MKNIKGNLLDVKDGYILQQVNCCGVMGSGLALAIREKWPLVHEKYLKLFSSTKRAWDLLGRCLLVGVEPGLTVVNLFAQYDYGRNGRYTEYKAFADALENFLFQIEIENRLPLKEIYIPKLIGCDRGGGDPDIVHSIIDYMAELYPQCAEKINIVQFA